MRDGLGRRLLAEFVGTAFLVAAVVGSGIAAQRLSPHDVGLLERSKRGVWVFYRARTEALQSLGALIGTIPVTAEPLHPSRCETGRR